MVVDKNKKNNKNTQWVVLLFVLFLFLVTPTNLLFAEAASTDTSFWGTITGGLSSLGSTLGITPAGTGGATGGTSADPAISKLNKRSEADAKAISKAIKATEDLQKKDADECKARQNGSGASSGNSGTSGPGGSNGSGGTGNRALSPTGNVNPDGTVVNPNQPGNQNDYNDPANPAYGNIDAETRQAAKNAKQGYIDREGNTKVAYQDSDGEAIGIGHKITGNEPSDIKSAIDSGTPLNDEQINRLYETDYAGAQKGAMAAAQNHGVDWDGLSADRKAALTDMTYNLGTGGIDNFNNMWNGVRTGNWQQASYEVTHDLAGGINKYATQTGKRAKDNAQTLLTGTRLADNWLNSGKNLLAGLWEKTKIAFTPQKAQAETMLDFSVLSGLTTDGLTQLLTTMGTEDLVSVTQNLTGNELDNVFTRIASGNGGSASVTVILEKIPGNIRGEALSQMSSGQLGGLFSELSTRQTNDILSNIPKPILGGVLDQMDGDVLSLTLGKITPDSAGRLLQYLPSGTFGNIVNKLPANFVGTLTGGMSSDLLGNLLTNAPSDIAGQLLGEMGGNIAGQVLSGMSGDIAGQLLNGMGGDLAGQLLQGMSGNLAGQLLNGMGGDLAGQLLNGMGGDIAGQLLGGLTGGSMSTLIQSLPTTALSALTGNAAVSGAIQTVMGGATSALQTAVAPALNAVGTALGPVGSTILSPLTSAVAGTVGGVVGGVLGGYVPVVEQSGKLMTATQNTDKTTKEIKDLDIQICTHLKAIQRIQTRAELKTMVQDYDTKVYRSTILANYANDILGEKGMIQTGYTDTKGAAAPLFVVNINQYIGDSRDEARNLAMTAIDSTVNDVTKDELVKTLNQDEENNTFVYQITPTLTKDELDKYKNNYKQTSGASANQTTALLDLPIIGWVTKPLAKIFGGTSYAADVIQPENLLSAEERGAIWLKLLEPKNNRYGSYLIATDAINEMKDTAEQDARDKANWGQGFVDVRKCKEWVGKDPNKACKTWETITPPSIVKDAASAAANSKLDQYINSADEKGSVGAGNEPTAAEAYNFKPTPGSGGAEGPALKPKVEASTEQKASGADKPASTASTISGADTKGPATTGGQTGTTGNTDGATATGTGFDMSKLTQMLNSLLSNNQGSMNQSSADLWALLKPFIDALISLFNNTTANQGTKPGIYFKQSSPSLTEIINGTKENKTTIIWTSPNATDCKAKNNWLSGNTIVKKVGDSLTKSSLIKVDLPLIVATAKLTKTSSGAVTEIGPTKTTNDQKTAETISFALSSNDVIIGDIFTLTIGDKNISYTAKTTSTSEVISGLVAQMMTFSDDNLSQTPNNLLVTPKIDYTITCTNTKGSTDGVISISR